jgi:hypothetical protein
LRRIPTLKDKANALQKKAKDQMTVHRNIVHGKLLNLHSLVDDLEEMQPEPLISEEVRGLHHSASVPHVTNNAE